MSNWVHDDDSKMVGKSVISAQSLGSNLTATDLLQHTMHPHSGIHTARPRWRYGTTIFEKNAVNSAWNPFFHFPNFWTPDFVGPTPSLLLHIDVPIFFLEIRDIEACYWRTQMVHNCKPSRSKVVKLHETPSCELTLKSFFARRWAALMVIRIDLLSIITVLFLMKASLAGYILSRCVMTRFHCILLSTLEQSNPSFRVIASVVNWY